MNGNRTHVCISCVVYVFDSSVRLVRNQMNGGFIAAWSCGSICSCQTKVDGHRLASIDYSEACEFFILATSRNNYGLGVWDVLRFVSVKDIVTTKCMLFVILLVIIVIGVVTKRKKGQRKSVYVSIILNYAPSPVINLLIPDVIVKI